MEPVQRYEEASMIAVSGAAGTVGGAVADLLLRSNQRVRVLEHRRTLRALAARGAEVVTGDLANPDDLKRLFQGAEAALLVLPDNPADPQFVATRSRMSAAMVEALRAARVPYAVLPSSAGARSDDAVGPPAGLRELERRLDELEDLNLLVLHSAFYMDNLLASLPMIRGQGVNGSAIDGDLRIPMIAARDVAREAAERLLRRDFSGHRAKLLLGAEDVSMRQATTAIGSLLGNPELPYIQFPPAEVRGALIGAGVSEQVATLVVEMQLAMNRGWPFAGLRRAPETATPTRPDEFLRQALPEVATR
jgi:uncharacterized protein YbjT (DUF2867 family)